MNQELSVLGTMFNSNPKKPHLIWMYKSGSLEGIGLHDESVNSDDFGLLQNCFFGLLNVLMYWTQILSEICHQSYCEKQQCFHFSSRGHMRKRQKDAHSFMSYHLIP